MAPNKLLAKLGSRLKKPDGLVVIEKGEVEGLLKDLPVSKLFGIGPKLERESEGDRYLHLRSIGKMSCRLFE